VSLEHTTALNILDSLLQNYDRRATPTNHLGQPTEVECKLHVRSLGSINPETMDYKVDLYLRQHWYDARLKNPHLTDPLDLNDPNLVKTIWKPEVYFPNAKDGEFQYVTVPNVLVRIDPGGQILYMLRLKLTFSCMMELSKFPLDEQICTMEIASFSKTTKELFLMWKEDGPVDISSEVKMPQFEISKVVAAKCQETFHIGNYSCLLAELHLKRSLGFHMVQSYLPTILIVVISWVSFWMDVDSVAGRTTLGVTTLLTISGKASDMQAEVPLVSYVKAIDIWMGACTTLIFAALLEFTLTNYLWRKGHKGRTAAGFFSDTSLADGIGVALAAATGAGLADPAGLDPVIGSAAVAGAATAANAAAGNGNGLPDDEFQMAQLQPTTTTSPSGGGGGGNHRHRKIIHHSKKCGENSEHQKLFGGITAAEMNGNFATIDAGGRTSLGPIQPLSCPPAGSGGGGAGSPNPHQQGMYKDGVFYCKLAVAIDECSRIIFPLAFGIFNFLYWSYYMLWSPKAF